MPRSFTWSMTSAQRSMISKARAWGWSSTTRRTAVSFSRRVSPGSGWDWEVAPRPLNASRMSGVPLIARRVGKWPTTAFPGGMPDGELGPDGVTGRGQPHVRRLDDSLPPRHHMGAMAQRRLRVCEVSCHAREVSYVEDPHAGLRPFRSPIKVPSREPAYVAGADGRMLAGLTPRP